MTLAFNGVRCQKDFGILPISLMNSSQPFIAIVHGVDSYELPTQPDDPMRDSS